MLRKILFLFALLPCWSASMINAQFIGELGFYGGTNMSKLNERFFDYPNRWGGQVGFTAVVGNKWCQGEISLSYLNIGHKYNSRMMLGMNDTGRSQIQFRKYKASAHYIDLPVSLALGWWNMDKSGFGLMVTGGAYVSAGLGGKIKVNQDVRSYNDSGVLYENFSTDELSTSYFGDNPHQYKRFDAGWTVGLRFGLGPTIRLTASYRQGLVNLSNIKGYKVTNRAIMIGLFLNFVHEDY